MKKQMLAACVMTAITLFTCRVSFGQQNNTFPATGSVGIGTNTPSYPFSLNKDIDFEASSYYRSIRARGAQTGLAIYSNSDWGDGASMLLNGNSGTSHPGSLTFVSGSAGQTGDKGFVFAKWNSSASTWDYQMTIDNNGQVAIADGNISLSSNDKLTIQGGLGLTEATSTDLRSIRAHGSLSGLAVYSNTDWSDGASILLSGNSASAHPGSVTLISGGVGQANDISYAFAKWDANATTWNYQMSIANDGQVVIGSVNTVPYNANNQPSYKLYVQTGILTEKVKVALSNDPYNNWSDFVFDDDYELKSLNEIEEYITENKHLPEIPSAKEVCKEGLDLAKMDAKLLQKIEELTLYVIQQQKEIDELKSKLSK